MLHAHLKIDWIVIYNSLLQNLQHTGLAVDLITIEIGCLGHFMPKTNFFEWLSLDRPNW